MPRLSQLFTQQQCCSLPTSNATQQQCHSPPKSATQQTKADDELDSSFDSEGGKSTVLKSNSYENAFSNSGKKYTIIILDYCGPLIFIYCVLLVCHRYLVSGGDIAGVWCTAGKVGKHHGSCLGEVNRLKRDFSASLQLHHH